MASRLEIAQATAQGLRRFAPTIHETQTVVGFDGFVDSIIAVVDKRHDSQRYDAVPTIAQLARKIQSAAGMSSNYELVVKLQKLGGNGPIMANALAVQGLAVTYLGALGSPRIHPVFQDLSHHAHCISFAEPAATDALEFEDGKLMLGKLHTLGDVNWDRLIESVGRPQILALFSQAQLIGMVNWTMLPHLSDIWWHLVHDVLPDLPAGPRDRRRIFVDLADPEKRTSHDIAAALALCTQFQKWCDTTLGLNLKEATQIARVLGLDPTGDPEAVIEDLACQIRRKLDIQTVVIHPRQGAAAATLRDGQETSARFAGPFTRSPRLSTGAGDNFNAGFCLGQLAGLPVDQALCAGVAASGFYVRNARSASVEEIARFCDDLPQPE